MESAEAHTNQAYNLLINSQALRQTRVDSPGFVRILSTNSSLLKDLLDISFRPRHFQATRKIKLTPEIPQLASETLSNLSDGLIYLLAYDKIVTKDQVVQDNQTRQEQNFNLIVPGSEEFLNLKYLHNVFENLEIDDASLSNLFRILGPLYHRCAKKIVAFYQRQTYYTKLFFKQLCRRQVVEFLAKLMEVQASNQFFKEFKDNLINQFYAVAKEGLKGLECHQWLQSVHYFHRSISQKIEDRSDGSKFCVLLQALLKNDQALMRIINENFGSYRIQTILVCQRWVQQSLKKDSLIMNESARQGGKLFKRRAESVCFFFFVDQRLTNVEYRVSKEYIIQTSVFLNHCLGNHVQKSSSTAIFVIYFYQAAYYWVKNAALWIDHLNGQQIQLLLSQFINEKFFQITFEAIRKHPRSTILHNDIKDLILVCIQKKLIPRSYFMKQDSSFRKTLIEWLPRKRKGLQMSFGAQIYHIFLQLIKVDVQPSDQILELISHEKLRRQKLIGGYDPRKPFDKQRSEKNHSSSQQSLQQIEINIPSFQNTAQVKNQDELPSQLPLSKKSSLQKQFTDAEERVIQKKEEE